MLRDILTHLWIVLRSNTLAYTALAAALLFHDLLFIGIILGVIAIQLFFLALMMLFFAAVEAGFIQFWTEEELAERRGIAA